MDLWHLLGYSKITFHSHSSPLPLQVDGTAEANLLYLCKSVTPPCWLNPLLPNGHFQTCWTVIKGQDPPVYYRRKIFTAEDPAFAGTFAVDFVVPPYKEFDSTLPPRTTYFGAGDLGKLGSDDEKPMLVALHGLSGGSHEVYLRHVLEPLFKDGFEACVVNARGCANSKLTSHLLFNARATWDVRQVVKWLRKLFPNRPLFAIGFSLGGNVLINYLGEEGDKCLLEAAVVCSNPWNLDVGAIALKRTWLGLEVYSKTMGTNLRSLFELHAEQISKNPRINVDKVRAIKYLHEFDRELQCPTWGYPTEGAYYRDASSSDSLLAVRTPLFAIHADDDPIAPKEAIPYQEFQKNPYTVLCTTKLGGHLAWFESGGGRWFVKPAIQFFKAIAKMDKLAGDHPGHRDPSKGRATSLDQDFLFNPRRRKAWIHGL